MAKLTARSIGKLAPPTGSGAREYPDDLLKGLVLVVHHSGKATWTVRYRNNDGQQRRYKLGRYPGMMPDKARKQARAILERVDNGEDPQAAKAAVRSGEITDAFLDQAIRFVETYCREKNRSWRAQMRMLGLSLNKEAIKDRTAEHRWTTLEGYPADRWRKRPVSSITKREIVEAVDAASKRGPIIANRTHATLTRFFNWATEKGLIDASPALGTKAPSAERSRERTLAGWELSAIWWACDELNPEFAACFRLLILTGARRNEVAGISANELADGVWTIPPARSKNGEAHQLPLPDAALDIIATLPRHPSGLLLSGNGRTPISGFSKAKRQLDEAIARMAAAHKGSRAHGRRLAAWTIHDIRRSVATGLAELGTEPHIIEAVLNHRTGTIKGIARVYNRFPYHQEKRDALERWANHVMGESMLG